MDALSFLIGALATTTLGAVVIFLAKTWVEKRIEASIRHEYDRKLAAFEHQREVRLKAELVADLLAEWIRRPEPNYFRLNQLSFQASLWLPATLANDLSNTLSHQPGADDLRTILRKIRRHLIGDDSFDAPRIVVFEHKANEA